MYEYMWAIVTDILVLCRDTHSKEVFPVVNSRYSSWKSVLSYHNPWKM